MLFPKSVGRGNVSLTLLFCTIILLGLISRMIIYPTLAIYKSWFLVDVK